MKVIAATRGTPADTAGVRPGDFITHINGQLFYGGTLDEAVERMRGQPGTSGPADHRPRRPRAAVRRQHHPRDHRHSGGPLRGARPGRNPHRHHLQPQHDRDGAAGDGGYRAAARRPAARLCHRSELQSGRPARSGGGPFRPVPGARRDRLAARPPADRHRALLCPAGRRLARRAARRAGRCGQRLGGGDRRRRASGPSPRGGDGRAQLRQGLGPDPDPARRQAAPRSG